MTYRVMYMGEPVGTASFGSRDADMAIAYGRFHPLPAYEALRDVFELFTKSLGDAGGAADRAKLAQYYSARDTLHLTLETEGGQLIETSFIHIVDWGGKEPDRLLEIEAQIPDPAFWAEGHPTA